MNQTSDFGSLSALANRKNRMYTCRKWLETAAILVGLIGGGTGLGYYFGIEQNQAVHVAEIDRMREAYRLNLYQITSQVKNAANSVETAAIQLDDVANMASKTTKQVSKVTNPSVPKLSSSNVVISR